MPPRPRTTPPDGRSPREPALLAARGWHAAIAVLVLVAVVLQVIVAARTPGTPLAVETGVVRGTSPVGRVIRVLSFFTIQSNLLCGLVSAHLALRPDRDGTGWRALRLAALFGIAVTGVVYSALLAGIHDPVGTAETVLNALVHYVVPVAVVLGWLAFGPRPRITAGTVLVSLGFPAIWFLYTLVRGALWKWYPYPFVDVTAHGYGTVLLNALGLTALFALVAGAFALGDRRLPPAPHRRPAVHSAGPDAPPRG